VTHRARCGADYRSGKSALTYKNGFTCFPSALPFRPKRLTAKPLVQGSQTAVVVGPKGEEIFTDKYGRVKVQFHWDREGKSDEDSSCWMRVGQLAAGRRWGASYWPRIGQEVLVDFLEGDPDQPIVVGTVYNADQMPPYLGQGPDGKHKNDNKVSGFKSNTTKGGKGFNELRFDDTKDKEQVFVHAERNMDVRVKKDAMESVGNDKHLTVGGTKDGESTGDYLALVHRNVHLRNKGDLVQHVGGDLRLRVGGDGGGGNVDVTIGNDRKTSVGRDDDLYVEGSRRVYLGGAENVRIHGKRITYLESDDSLEISGNRKECTAGTINSTCMDHDHTTLGSFRLSSQGEISIVSDQSVAIETPGTLSLACGQSSVTLTNGGIWISGPRVHINSGNGPLVDIQLTHPEVGDAPAQVLAPAEAAPTEPTAADDAKTGQKSS
jgi:type VI secretion system secreted protein VgrG